MKKLLIIFMVVSMVGCATMSPKRNVADMWHEAYFLLESFKKDFPGPQNPNVVQAVVPIWQNFAIAYKNLIQEMILTLFQLFIIKAQLLQKDGSIIL